MASGDAASGDAATADARIAQAIPAAVLELLRTLWQDGQAAFVVGGALRDVLAGRPTAELRVAGSDGIRCGNARYVLAERPTAVWDLATSALPERTAELFDDAVYENRFGTVGVRRGGVDHQITTFRSDHDYADFRRPHRVEFGTSLEADLARRDFTMNALAWGAEPAAADGVP